MKPGFLVIHKPVGITSHDVVAMVRAVTGVRKVGHTGTLDPFATGVLPLALGSATRLIQFLDEDIKIYDGHIALGSATDTGDPTGEVIREIPVPALTTEGILEALASFKGTRLQEPPRHSAVKVKGKRLYSYARQGIDVRAKPRPIRIDGIDLLSLDQDCLRVRIHCGRGTYARVLADEIAQELGTTGHLSKLHRNRSGPFTDAHAITLEEVATIVADNPDWQKVLRRQPKGERVPWKPREEVRAALAPRMLSPLEALSHLPVASITRPQHKIISNGGRPPPAPAGLELDDLYLLAEGKVLTAVVRHTSPLPKVVRIVTNHL